MHISVTTFLNVVYYISMAYEYYHYYHHLLCVNTGYGMIYGYVYDLYTLNHAMTDPHG